MLLRKIRGFNSGNCTNHANVLSERSAECTSVQLPMRPQSHVQWNLLTSNVMKGTYASSATVYATRISTRNKNVKQTQNKNKERNFHFLLKFRFNSLLGLFLRICCFMLLLLLHASNDSVGGKELLTFCLLCSCLYSCLFVPLFLCSFALFQVR